MTDQQEQRKSINERWCFVCGETIPADKAVVNAHLGILTHQAPCGAIVDQYVRVYDRSPQGRWRSGREARQLLRERRQALEAPASDEEAALLAHAATLPWRPRFPERPMVEPVGRWRPERSLPAPLPDLALFVTRLPYRWYGPLLDLYRGPQIPEPSRSDDPRTQIEASIHAIPILTYAGVGVAERYTLAPDVHLCQLQEGRAKLLAATDAFVATCQWLRDPARPWRQTVNRHHTSYGLKHLAEQAIDRYVSNGTFIAAALHCGLTYQLIPHSFNIWVSISTAWVHAQARSIWQQQRAQRTAGGE